VLDKPSKQEKAQEAIIRRGGRKHDDEGHGGAWKVAFADFCLALMCLFLVMWVMAARDKEAMQAEFNASGGSSQLQESSALTMKAIGGSRGSLIERFAVSSHGEGGPSAPAKARYESKEDLQTLSRMLMDLSAEGGLASNLQTIVTPYGLRIMLHDTDRQGMYVRGSAIPTDRFQALLRKMGPLFAQMENQMLIIGHTDAMQYADQQHGGMSNNWTLSSNRAMSARAQLLAGGMAGDSILQVVGMADRAPIDDAHPAAGVNRRIELLILTSGQAQAIASMFGMPGDAQPLTRDVDTALPDADALKSLRNKLLPAKRGASPAS
jgi:chemotaxis protein MotB